MAPLRVYVIRLPRYENRRCAVRERSEIAAGISVATRKGNGHAVSHEALSGPLTGD